MTNLITYIAGLLALLVAHWREDTNSILAIGFLLVANAIYGLRQ